MLRLAGPLGLFLIWSVLTFGGFVDPQLLPSPAALAAHFWLIAVDGYNGHSLLDHIGMSMMRAICGFVLGAAAGIPAGLMLGYYRKAGTAFEAIFAFLRPIPPIAYIPLAALYLGIGEASKIVLIFVAVFLFVVLNVQDGIKGVPSTFLRAGKNIGLTPTQMFRYVLFPSVLPSVMTALRLGMSIAWALVVAAELLAAQSGLGYMIQDAATFFHLDTVFVGIILIGIGGLVLDSIIRFGQRKLVHWEGKS